MSDTRDFELPAPADIISSVAFSPVDPKALITAGWDNTVTLFDVSIRDPAIAQRQSFPHSSAVLDACFAGQSGPQGKIYSGGLDRNVREIDLSTSQQTLLGAHNDAVRCVRWSDEANALLTASWDKTLALFDPRAPPPPTTPWVGLSCPLPAKAYAFDTAGNNVVVAMGARHVWIYDIRKLSEGLKASEDPATRNVTIDPDQKRESSLKFMTRSIRCNPAGDAYANTSIEGRVAVEFFDQRPEIQAKKYAFKCHRAVVDGVDTVYPVNALAFHPVHGTFATGGGDAMISIWDLVAKKRLRQLPKYPASISALDFSKDGTWLAVACTVMEEEGTHTMPGARNAIFVRQVADDCKDVCVLGQTVASQCITVRVGIAIPCKCDFFAVLPSAPGKPYKMRYYEPRFPEPEELVMVQVKQIQEMGAYVKLLEYDNIEGMILLSELSRRRIRSIQKLIRVGRNEVVVVMRVDKEKGYIDLSKRRVSAEDVVKCEERYNKSKAVHSIMRHVAERTGKDLEELNALIAWPLYKRFGHAFEAFKLSITDAPAVFGELVIPDDVLENLRENIARRLTPQPVKIRADIDLTCFSYAGIDAIRRALRAGESLKTDAIPIQIRLVAPPLYVIISNATDKTGAIEALENAIAVIREEIQKDNGELVVKRRPAAVSESDDVELNALMERVARENAEVSGDEEPDQDEE